jgi:ribulose-phosphate 3-epimerase
MRSPQVTAPGATRNLSTSLGRMSWAEWADAVEIEPSIYASDFSRLGEQLGLLRTAGARVFHFDVGDGHFIPEITIGPVVAASISPLIRGWGARLDCHLMVSEPEKHFEAIAKAGGDSVTFHLEVCDEPGRAIAQARSLGLAVGVALNPETAVEDVVAAAGGADLVLCMSIHPGYSGQAFMPDALDRIARLCEALPPGVRLQVDGGINAETARAARDAGADLLVAGSAIFWNDDPAAAYAELVGLVTEAAHA